MLKAVEFEILRDIPSKSTEFIKISRCPLYVATLLNEESFQESQFLVHDQNIHLEDAQHDWDWRFGKFRFYARANDVCDVLLVYEAQNIQYDPMTGTPINAT